MVELRLVIPAIPPSGNNYTRSAARCINGRWQVVHYHTPRAKAWWATVAAVAAGRRIVADWYTVSWVVYFPNARLTDPDNLEKTLFDGIKKASVITDDRHIRDHHGYTRVDRLNPRTEIIVRSEQGRLF